MFIIAIDGPAASGKSSAAELVAKKLNFERLDSGLIYRAITYLLIENHLIDNFTSDESKKFIKSLEIEQKKGQIFYNKWNITKNLRTIEIDSNVGVIAKELFVREKVHEIQYQIVKNLEESSENVNGVVVDGRDIGTVVFPNANLKIFIDADAEVRAKRRSEQTLVDYHKVLDDLIIRDEYDRKRKHGPLIQASDAYLIENSAISLEDTVSKIISLYKSKILN